MPEADNPILAKFRPIAEYSPTHGDLIIISNWFSVKFGLVLGTIDGNVTVVCAGHPRVLFTMGESQQAKNITTIKLSALRENNWARYSIQKHEKQEPIWYV